MSRPQPINTGPMAGWSQFPTGYDPFETHVAPFYIRDEPDGTTRSAVMPDSRHANAGGALHGGFLMTFADFALFAIASREIQGAAVTVSCTCDFLAPARPGELIEATGEVVRAGRSLVFVRGLATQGDRAVLSFSGVLKKVG